MGDGECALEGLEVTSPRCSFCQSPLSVTLADLGRTPLANAYVKPERAGAPDPSYPLHARVCGSCFLVQVEPAVPADEIFSDYDYLSSMSASWVAHAETYAHMMIARFGLTASAHVVEIASNDGYLLQHFAKRGIPVLGIDPAANLAPLALEKGVPTEVAFFGRQTAARLTAQGKQADVIAANNVLAHVPDINDFVAGFATLLKPSGVLTVEFPHLKNLIERVEFDTIYHEHYSYLSLLAVEKIFAAHGLKVFDVEELKTHGGSLRIFAQRVDGPARPEGPGLNKVRADEKAARLDQLEGYAGFETKVAETKKALLAFLAEAKKAGLKVAAYGAAAKGNTLLNFCGVTAADLMFVADKAPTKQGKFLPGSRVPVLGPDAIEAQKPDVILILPWNIADEVMSQLAPAKAWGARFAVAIPTFHYIG